MNHCNDLSQSLRQSEPRAIRYSGPHGTIAAIEAIYHPARHEPLELYRAEAALILFQLRTQLRMSFRVDDFSHRIQPFHNGTVFGLDLRRKIELDVTEPCHMLAIHVPHEALRTAAMAAGVSAPLRQAHAGVRDSLLAHLGMTLVDALKSPSLGLPADHGRLFGAFLDRYIDTLSVSPECRQVSRRCLSSREVDALMAIVSARLTLGLTVTEAAAACGLTQITFERAFRHSTGMTPHQWLISRRIDVAMGLMVECELPLAYIAIDAGFADQSHFTHTFTRRVGASPSTWRRYRAGNALRSA